MAADLRVAYLRVADTVGTPLSAAAIVVWELEAKIKNKKVVEPYELLKPSMKSSVSISKMLAGGSAGMDAQQPERVQDVQYACSTSRDHRFVWAVSWPCSSASKWIKTTRTW